MAEENLQDVDTVLDPYQEQDETLFDNDDQNKQQTPRRVETAPQGETPEQTLARLRSQEEAVKAKKKRLVESSKKVVQIAEEKPPALYPPETEDEEIEPDQKLSGVLNRVGMNGTRSYVGTIHELTLDQIAYTYDFGNYELRVKNDKGVPGLGRLKKFRIDPALVQRLRAMSPPSPGEVYEAAKPKQEEGIESKFEALIKKMTDAQSSQQRNPEEMMFRLIEALKPGSAPVTTNGKDLQDTYEKGMNFGRELMQSQVNMLQEQIKKLEKQVEIKDQKIDELLEELGRLPVEETIEETSAEPENAWVSLADKTLDFLASQKNKESHEKPQITHTPEQKTPKQQPPQRNKFIVMNSDKLKQIILDLYKNKATIEHAADTVGEAINLFSSLEKGFIVRALKNDTVDVIVSTMKSYFLQGVSDSVIPFVSQIVTELKKRYTE